MTEFEPARTRRAARVVSAALALLVLLWLRLPTNRVDILNVDEADFVVEASALLDGGRPYIDFVEKKPPLIYYLYAGGLALVGRYNLPAFRLLLVGYVFASALLAAAIARRVYGERAALIAAPAYALAVSAGLPMDFHAANAETLFLLPLLAGTYFVLPTLAGPEEANGRRAFAAGALIGLASLIKQQAGMQLPIALAAMALAGTGRWKRIALASTGFASVWALALAGLAAASALDEFYYWTVDINRYYIAHGNSLRDGLPLLAAALQTMFGFAPALWALAAARLLHELIAARVRRSLVLLWFFGSLVPIALGGRYFSHYFLQLFPPLVLLASSAAAAVWERLDTVPRARSIAVVAFVALLVVRPAAAGMAPFHDAEALSVPHAMPDARAVARYVRDHTAPDARVLFWGYGSALYYLSQRRPATRFPYVTYLVGAVEGTPAWWSPFHSSRPLEIPRAWDLFFEDLAKHPPALVVDTSEPGYFAFYKFPPRKYPRLARYLEAHYRRTEVSGFPVWTRNEEAVLQSPLR